MMKQTCSQTPQTPLALQALCDQAGAQAAGAAAPIRRPAAGTFATTFAGGPKTMAGLACGLVALGVWAAHWLANPGNRGDPGPVPASPAAAAMRALPSWPTLAGLAPGTSNTTAAAGPLAPVHWQGPLLVMQLQQLPLAQAVAQLAQATQSTVSGLDLLRQPGVMTIDWRGRDIGAAWQYLLQGRASFSVSCASASGGGGGGCHVWINSERLRASAAAGPTGPESGPQQTRAGHEPAEIESQPDGSC